MPAETVVTAFQRSGDVTRPRDSTGGPTPVGAPKPRSAKSRCSSGPPSASAIRAAPMLQDLTITSPVEIRPCVLWQWTVRGTTRALPVHPVVVAGGLGAG